MKIFYAILVGFGLIFSPFFSLKSSTVSKSFPSSYLYSCVILNLLYGINMVVRGNDLLTSSAAQLQLANLLGLSTFAQTDWHHHSLIRNEQGQKISKSAGDLSVSMMIKQGMKPVDFLRRIAAMLGLPERPCHSLNELHTACMEKGHLPQFS